MTGQERSPAATGLATEDDWLFSSVHVSNSLAASEKVTERSLSLRLAHPRVQELLRSVPVAGDGLNVHIFKLAHALKHHCAPEEAFGVIAQATANRGRAVKANEIRRAIQRAFNATCNGHAIQQWPEPDLSAMLAITLAAADSCALAEMYEDSPVWLPDDKTAAETVIDALFPAGSLICAGQSMREFWTADRNAFRGSLHRLQFIVPNPMVSEKGRMQDGAESFRTLSNTGARRYVVTEFDIAPVARDGVTKTKWHPLVNEWAAHGMTPKEAMALLIRELAKYLPLAVVVDSGGKSLHAWFYCSGAEEERLRRFMAYAAHLGADRATWTRCQFVRMPGGTRDNGNRQVIHYFNPEVAK